MKDELTLPTTPRRLENPTRLLTKRAENRRRPRKAPPEIEPPLASEFNGAVRCRILKEFN